MREREPANVPAIVLSILGIITFGFLASFAYMSLNGADYTQEYIQKIQSGEVVNPITQFALLLSDSDSEDIPEGAQVITVPTEDGEKRIIIQANLEGLDLEDIERELVNYGAIVLKLYNLHETPFTRNTPKVEIYVDESEYNVEVTKGNLIVRDGKTSREDIIIRTTHEEIFKMIEDENYASESISSGRTSMELVANKFVLFTKGYLSLYNEFSQ